MGKTVTLGNVQIFRNNDGSLRVVDKKSGKITNVQPGDHNFGKFEEMYKAAGGD